MRHADPSTEPSSRRPRGTSWYVPGSHRTSATGTTAPRSTWTHSPPRWGRPGAPEGGAVAVRHAPGRRPPPSLAVTRNVAGASSRTGGATSAKSSYAPPSRLTRRNVKRDAERLEVRLEPRRAPRRPPGGGRGAVDRAREARSNLLVGIRHDRADRRQDREHSPRGVGVVEPAKAGALEALHGRALRVELGALGRRDGRMEIARSSRRGRRARGPGGRPPPGGARAVDPASPARNPPSSGGSAE